ncbi:hypothetical protein JCM5296_000268 [Sporobolomyces johnsonii]
MANSPSPSLDLSDPANAWTSTNPFAALQNQSGEGSVAESVGSVGSQARRTAAEAEYAAQSQARLEAYQRQEELLRQQMEESLRMEDALSEVFKQEATEDAFLKGELVQPLGSAAEAEAEVLRRELEDLKSREASIQRLLAARSGTQATPPEVAPLAEVSIKVKVSPPDKWRGKFDYVEREAWIATVEGYLASIGLALDATLDKSLTPYPFFIVRTLFSADATHGGSSPLSWFDARQRRTPFTSAQQVLDAVRAHWRDDHAAEAALTAYRSARQGALRARDFGSRVETLADACFDRDLDEQDRIATFVLGLNSNYKEYLKTQMALLSKLGRSPVTLQDVVGIAAVADGLESFASSLKRTGAVSSPSSPSKKGNAAHVPAVPSSTGSGSAPGKGEMWRRRAEEWQKTHPAAARQEWQRDSSSKPSQPVLCYHCGQLGDHYSTACKNPRKDPKTVLVAAIRAKLSSSVPLSPSPLSSSNLIDMDDEESDSSGSGKVDGE